MNMRLLHKIGGTLLAPFIILGLLFVMAANTGVLCFLDITGLSALFTKFLVRQRFGNLNPGSAIDLDRAQRIVAGFSATGKAKVEGNPHIVTVNGKLGIRVNLKPDEAKVIGAPKYAYYVEGSHFEMGVLLGLLAESSIRRMSIDFVDNVIFDYMKIKGDYSLLGRIAADFIYLISRYSDAIVPDELTAEIWGLWHGSRLAKPQSGISLRKLFVLNYGIDIILSWVYAGTEALLTVVGIKIADFRPPAACNGFAAFGPQAAKSPEHKDGFWFGRDFMFPTCGPVFGECAAHIVYNGDGHISPRSRLQAAVLADDPTINPRSLPYRNPDQLLLRALINAPGHGSRRAGLQLVFGAPGMVGAVATVNASGVAMGADMINSRNCSWRRVGLNSLMMIRYATQYSDSAEAVVSLMTRLPRGVSWLYLLASASPEGDKAAAIEATMKTDNNNFLRYTPSELRKIGSDGKSLLPDADFISKHSSGPYRQGLMVRWHNWQQDPAWFDFNQKLFEHYQRKWEPVKDQWGVRGQLCTSKHDYTLPGSFYFAPQRDKRDNLMLAGNQHIMPEMRLLGMSDWSNLVAAESDYCDFQWRYDVLNNKLDTAINNGPMDQAKARDIINFLRPYNSDGSKAEFHAYYGVHTNPDGSQQDIPFHEVMVFGSVSLFDLRSLSIETLYDHYADPWVPVSLKGFIGL